jgi:hypothetical protein
MQRQEITIQIHPDGRVEYLIKGVQGSGCESISALLEQLGHVEVSERTAEYGAREPDAQEQINVDHG